MALIYGDNYVHIIKKNNVEYKVRDAVAEAAINTIQGDASTEGSILKAKADAISTASSDATTKANAAETAAKSYADSLASHYDAAGSAAAAETAAKSYADGLASNYDAAGSAASAESAAKSYADGLASNYDASGDAAAAETAAKTYAKGLVDNVLGSDSSAQIITNLQNVLNELNDPDNAQGIPGTFVDTVKAGLAGLGNTQAVYYTQEECDDYNLENNLSPGDEGYRTTSDIKTASRPVTVKEYVDGAVADVTAGQSQSSIENGILTLGL